MVNSRKGGGVLLMILCLFLISPLWAQEGEKETAKERDFLLLSESNRVVIGLDKKEWEFDLKVVNKGKQQEEVLLSVQAPPGWKANVQKKWDGYEVKGVTLGPDDENKSVLLSLKVVAPERVKEGVDYHFSVKAQTADGKIVRSLDYVLSFKKGVKAAEAKAIKVKAEYPSLKGAPGDKFEYVLEIKNDSDKVQSFELLAEAPAGWASYCTPRWEEEKKISMIKVDAKSSEWIKFFLVPPPMVKTGEYPARLVVKSETEQTSVDLKAVISGTYELKLASESEVFGSGETRNVKAIAGKEKRWVLFVWNEGSAPITDLNFYVTSKPKDWEVTFEPKKIPTLNPIDPRTPEFHKVEVKIKPKEKAVPGDYVVGISAVGKEDKADVELRVTVGKPAVWGWIGMGIVGVVVAALVLVFVKLGRR